jgi:hypothetical protein
MRRSVQAGITLVVAFLAGSARAQGPGGLGTEEFGLTNKELVQHIEKVEALIAKCMRDQGFEYIAADYSTVRRGMIADKSLPGLSEDEFIKKYGFGISTFYTGTAPQLAQDYSPTKVGLGKKNIEMYQSLSPADQVAYNRALFGDDATASFAVGLETEDFSRCGGCTRAAIEQVFEPEQMEATYYNPVDALINKDPRMKAALRKYADKMHAQGFDYNHPDDVEPDIRHRLSVITDGLKIPLADLSPERLEELRKLQDYERKVAVVDNDLASEIFEPVEEAIQKEMFAREVK